MIVHIQGRTYIISFHTENVQHNGLVLPAVHCKVEINPPLENINQVMGMAICSRKDKYSFPTGQRVALARALELASLDREIKKVLHNILNDSLPNLKKDGKPKTK